MWYGKIKTRIQNPAENYLIVEIKGKPKQLETLTSKDIYKTLYEQIWGEIRLDELYFEMYWKQNCVDRKIRDFDWKCIQDAVNTEVRMIKYKYSNGKCKFCEIDET